MARRTKRGPKQVEALKHDEAKRKNIPTAELQSAAQRAEEISPFEPVTYLRQDPLPKGEKRPRDPDLDPQIVWKGATLRLSPDQIAELSETGRLEIGDAQLVWRGKDQQDWSDLVVQAPPLYIQEKVHPKAIIEDLKHQTKDRREAETDVPDLFADFNGIDPEAKTEFYQHDQNWQNRMILGDSLQVMASLAEREGLRGQVQCIYFDPPYGIKFNSNWQVSTRSRDVKDGKLDQITREPEQVKAFRDTWKDGIHSYLTYLRDRLTAMRDLLTESGSIFVQIGDENVHRVRALMDEVFGEENFCSLITFVKTSGQTDKLMPSVSDYLLWFARDKSKAKYRRPVILRSLVDAADGAYRRVALPNGEKRTLSKEERDDLTKIPDGSKIYRQQILTSQSPGTRYIVNFQGNAVGPSTGYWKTQESSMPRLIKADRVEAGGKTLSYTRYADDYPVLPINNFWSDTGWTLGADKAYVVQTGTKIVQRCILMATDPGDLVLDPTCGSGTTATVAEQWGRRWITIDTSRVALALARARLMGARFPYYLLADTEDGKRKEADLTGRPPSDAPVRGDLRQGFVYERAPHITLKSIANNAEIDVIWEIYQQKLEPLRERLNAAVGKSWEEWEIPREAEDGWSAAAKKTHADWWTLRIARQQEIDKSIAQKADVELLYDRPYEDTSKVRVSGPFTVESLSPHRVVPADEAELIEELDAAEGKRERAHAPLNDFTTMVLENLKSAGVHQAAKDDRITFTALEGWPGGYIAAEGHFMEGEQEAGSAKGATGTQGEKRAAIFIGPEFGTVTRADLTAAAREALDARFDALIACGFNFDAHTSELTKLGPLPILKAKMNPDLHMSEELKNTGAGNLFVVFGEPDIEWRFDDDGNIVVEVLGVDVFDPKTGEVRASGKDDIAAWFIDTDYNEESFFVRHAYFMGASDPYKALKTSLKAEIDKEAWETLYRDTSRPFARPSTGRFAVKVINHFGDEVMKVFAV
ncbi:site-specific DNA-methyltransferase [Pelagibius sp.]|uniref:site-specific DNA-methyltransferase n=1 Tax=Pelagibius sp. TaxID=1931238 RepID=UPI003B505664